MRLIIASGRTKRSTCGTRVAALLAAVAALGGCGGGGGGSGGAPPSQKYTVGGSVAGLVSGDSVVLLDNSGDALTVSTNGSFAFSTALASDTNFTVTVGTQPTDQTCTVAQGSGIVATQSITSVAVTCVSAAYPLGGSIGGLGYASGLVLANGSDTLDVPPGTTNFTMPKQVAYGSAYDVTVAANPLALTCTITNGSGSGTQNGSDQNSVTVGCAASESVLYSFAGGSADGATPYGNIIQASDGNFYGTTSTGGPSGKGAIFKITPDGTETILHLFAGGTTDGYNATGGLIEGTDGNFYGSTSAGGANGDGTVFEITPDGTETILYSFGAQPGDGQAPVGSLLQASDGNFYGFTSAGGNYNLGTVFRVTPGGTEIVLHPFYGGTSDGASPDAATLIQGNDGNLYGMTSQGGPSNDGSVFMLTLGGAETILHFFTGAPDGAFPNGHLIQASDGNFYGVTPGGGDAWGTVFEVTPSGAETVLYGSFGGSPGPDLDPEWGLVQATDGNFYGVTAQGAGGNGTIFEINSAGQVTHLYSFGAGTDGVRPIGLIQASDGEFYGVTAAGGTSGNGTVFKLK